MKAKDLVKPKETAIIIMTDGRGLALKTGGLSTSGVWKIAATIKVDKVIIYYRNNGRNAVYVGNFVQLLPSNEKNLPDRKVVQFSDCEFLEYTDSMWYEFIGAKPGAANPIKYIR